MYLLLKDMKLSGLNPGHTHYEQVKIDDQDSAMTRTRIATSWLCDCADEQRAGPRCAGARLAHDAQDKIIPVCAFPFLSWFLHEDQLLFSCRFLDDTEYFILDLDQGARCKCVVVLLAHTKLFYAREHGPWCISVFFIWIFDNDAPGLLTGCFFPGWSWLFDFIKRVIHARTDKNCFEVSHFRCSPVFSSRKPQDIDFFHYGIYV